MKARVQHRGREAANTMVAPAMRAQALRLNRIAASGAVARMQAREPNHHRRNRKTVITVAAPALKPAVRAQAQRRARPNRKAASDVPTPTLLPTVQVRAQRRIPRNCKEAEHAATPVPPALRMHAGALHRSRRDRKAANKAATPSLVPAVQAWVPTPNRKAANIVPAPAVRRAV